MRTTEENAKIDSLARALLERRGIREPTFAEYADAAELAAEAVERRGVECTLAECLGVAAIGDSAPDETLTKVLARHATDGRFVADLSLDEETLLRDVVAAEQAADARTVLAEDHPGGVEYVHGSPYCGACGYALSSGLCKC